jgi:hypothetical protein
MRSGHLIVRPHRPLRSALFIAFWLAVLGATAYVAYERGRVTIHGDYLTVSAEHEALQAANRRLEEANGDLRERNTVLERTRQIDGKAYKEVDQHLKELQQEVLDLKEELAFYRSIVSSDEARALDIQSFEVRRDGGRDEYQYRVVLTGAMKNDRVISGTVNLSVFGERRGRAVTLSLRDLSDAQRVNFRLKHFQKIRGRLKLPRDFIPRRVSVQVSASGVSPKKIEKSFDWSARVG